MEKRKTQNIVFVLYAILVTAVVLYQLHNLQLTIQAQRQVQKVENDLKKLIVSTAALLEHRSPVTEDTVLRFAGINALDPWDMPYQMLVFPQQLHWKSAGPDHRWDTQDDID